MTAQIAHESLTEQRRGAPVTVLRVRHGFARLSCDHVVPNVEGLGRHARTACLLCVPAAKPWAPPTLRKLLLVRPIPNEHPALQGSPNEPVNNFPRVSRRTRHRRRSITITLECGHVILGTREQWRLPEPHPRILCRPCRSFAERRSERVFIHQSVDGNECLLVCGHIISTPFEDQMRTVRQSLLMRCLQCEPGANWERTS